MCVCTQRDSIHENKNTEHFPCKRQLPGNDRKLWAGSVLVICNQLAACFRPDFPVRTVNNESRRNTEDNKLKIVLPKYFNAICTLLQLETFISKIQNNGHIGSCRNILLAGVDGFWYSSIAVRSRVYFNTCVNTSSCGWTWSHSSARTVCLTSDNIMHTLIVDTFSDSHVGLKVHFTFLTGIERLYSDVCLHEYSVSRVPLSADKSVSCVISLGKINRATRVTGTNLRKWFVSSRFQLIVSEGYFSSVMLDTKKCESVNVILEVVFKYVIVVIR
jgi:hypothetical protein